MDTGKKISEMTPATLPLAGSEIIPSVQAGANVNLSPNNILAILNSLEYSGLNTSDKHVITAINELLTAIGTKADILPATGAKSALRALFIARGATYNGDGTYTLGGITDITESQMIVIYNDTSQTVNNRDLTYALMGKTFRTAFKGFSSKYFPKYSYADCFTNNINLESVDDEFVALSFQLMFRGCINLHTAKRINCDVSTNNTNVFYVCVKLVNAEIYLLKTNFQFAHSPLLSLESLQYLVTNRGNGTTRITITVHATVWAKLNDNVGYPTWNALLVEAWTNQYIDFASA